MPIFHEAKRVKGQEYNRLTKQKGMPPTNGDGYEDRYGTVSLGKGGVLDSTAQSQIEKINVEKEKLLLESNNLLKEYDEYVSGNIVKASETYGDNSENNIGKRMLEEYNTLRSWSFFIGKSENDIFNMIRDEYYGGNAIYKDLGIDPNNMSSDDEKKAEKVLRQILKLRMNYINKITSLMSKMLQINYKELGLSESEAQQYIQDLGSGDNKSVETAGKVKDLIKNNSDKFMANGGDAIDLTSLGFGVILGPSKGYRLGFGSFKTSNKDSMLTLIQKAMRYDVVVVAHGSDVQDSYVRNGFKKKKVTQLFMGAAGDANKKYATLFTDETNKFNKQLDPEDASTIHTVDTNMRSTIIPNAVKDSSNNNILEYIKKCRESFNALRKLDNSNEVMKIIVKCTEDLYSKFKSDLYKKINDGIKELGDNYYEVYNKYKSKMGVYIHTCISISILSVVVETMQKGIKTDTNQESYWGCQPTKTLKAGPFDNMDDLVRQLIKEGYKKICIEDCNPGGHKLADDIMKTKGVLINYSNFSNYVESEIIDTNDPYMVSIMEAEQSIIEYASNNDIDYCDNQYLIECMEWYENGAIIHEGVVDSLKEFAHKVLAAIVGFLKRLIGLVKRAYESLKSLFKGSKDKPKDQNTKFDKPIETPLIDIKSKKVEKTKSSNRLDLDKAGSEMCKNIADEIKDMNNKQNKSMKNIEKDIETLSKTSKNEGAIFMDDELIDEFGMFPEIWDVLYEFEINGQNQDADDLDTLGDDDDNSNDDNSQAQAIQNPQDNQQQPNTQDDDEPDNDENFSMDDDSSNQDNQENTDNNAGDNNGGDNPQGIGEEPDEQDNDENFDIPDDNDSDTSQDEGNGDEGTASSDDQEEDNDDNFSMDDDDGARSKQNTDSESQEDGLSDDESYQDSKLKELETVTFENLTDAEKKIKIKELKDIYGNLFDKCKLLADRTNDIRKDSETIRITEYISDSLINLRQYIKDYLDNIFDSKTYIENLSQVQKYIAVLNSINTIFVELGKDDDQ